MIGNKNFKDWRLLWQLFQRRWLLFCITVLISIGVGLVVAFMTEPEFESVSTLMILDTDLLSGSSLRFVPGSPQRDEVEYFRRRITSVEFLKKMLQEVDYTNEPKVVAKVAALSAQSPDVPLAEIEEIVAIEYLQKKIATQKRAFNIIDLQARGKTAHEAYNLGIVFTDMAITESQKSQVELASFASTFSNQLLENYKMKLNEAELRLELFEKGNIASATSEFLLDAEKLKAIESVLLSLGVEIEMKEESRDELSNELQNMPKGYRTELERMTADMRAKMLQRTANVCQLYKKFDWKDVEISLLNEEIARLQKSIIDTTKSTITKHSPGLSESVMAKLVRLESLNVELSRLQQQQNEYALILDSHNEFVNSQPSKEAYLARLKNEVTKYKELFDLLQQQLRGNQIRETAQQQEAQIRFRLLVPPQRPLERVKPQRKKILLLSVFFGVIFGVSIIFGLETMNTTIQSVEEVVDDLKVPVLATIPRMDTVQKEKKKEKYKVLVLFLIPVMTVFAALVIYKVFLQ